MSRYNVVMSVVACIVNIAATECSAGDADAGDPYLGEQLFRSTCAICHEIGPGAQHHVEGPQLENIIGRKSGSAKGWMYSQSMQNAGIIWNE